MSSRKLLLKLMGQPVAPEKMLLSATVLAGGVYMQQHRGDTNSSSYTSRIKLIRMYTYIYIYIYKSMYTYSSCHSGSCFEGRKQDMLLADFKSFGASWLLERL